MNGPARFIRTEPDVEAIRASLLEPVRIYGAELLACPDCLSVTSFDAPAPDDTYMVLASIRHDPGCPNWTSRTTPTITERTAQ